MSTCWASGRGYCGADGWIVIGYPTSAEGWLERGGLPGTTLALIGQSNGDGVADIGPWGQRWVSSVGRMG